MRSLVTGATGFLGEALVRELAAAHGPESVVACARAPLPETERPAAERLEAAGVRLTPVDLLALPAAASPPPFDVLYHLAAETDSGASALRCEVNFRGLANLLETIGPEAMAGKRVVLAGATAAVDRGRKPRAPLREDDPACPRTNYGRSKLIAERVLAECAAAWKFSFTVPRFSPVWEPSLSTGFLKAFREMAERRALVRRVAWPGRVSLVRREDAAKVLRFLGESGAADGRAVNVADGEVHRYAALLRDVRLLVEGKAGTLPVPGLLWGLLRWMIWLPVAKKRVPWRLSCLLGDDLAADATLLKSLVPFPLRTWTEGAAERTAAVSSPPP